MDIEDLRHSTISANFPTFVKTRRNPTVVATTAIKEGPVFIEDRTSLTFSISYKLCSKIYRRVSKKLSWSITRVNPTIYWLPSWQGKSGLVVSDKSEVGNL